MLKNVYLAGGVRTPFGSFNSALSNLTAAKLGSLTSGDLAVVEGQVGHILGLVS